MIERRVNAAVDRYVEDWPGAVAELETVARPEDMILYGTAFAEADQLRLAAPDPLRSVRLTRRVAASQIATVWWVPAAARLEMSRSWNPGAWLRGKRTSGSAPSRRMGTRRSSESG